MPAINNRYMDGSGTAEMFTLSRVGPALSWSKLEKLSLTIEVGATRVYECIAQPMFKLDFPEILNARLSKSVPPHSTRMFLTIG